MPCTKKSTKQFHCHGNESSLWPCLDSKYHPSGRLGTTSNFSFTFHWLLNKRLENKENEHWPQEKEAWSHEQNFLLQNHWQHNRRIKNSVESTNRFNLSWKGFKIIFFIVILNDIFVFWLNMPEMLNASVKQATKITCNLLATLPQNELKSGVAR